MERELLHTYLRKSISLAPERLREYVVDIHGRDFFHRWVFYRLKKLLNDFIEKKSENRWILLPGMRGTGKTTLLAQVYFYLMEKKIPQSNILYLSLDEVTKLLDSDLNEIISVYEEFLGKNLESLDRNVFLLIDEAHYDKNWAITLKTVFDRTRKIFIISTGSSSLSLQTGSDIARRAQIEKVLPLSFTEYIMLKYRILPVQRLKSKLEDAVFFSRNAEEVFIRLKEIENKTKKYLALVKPLELQVYLKTGTLPFALGLSNEIDVYSRIINILEKVINEDIPAIKVFDKEVLDKIWNLLLLFSVSEKLNYESICNKLDISKPTLNEILNVLTKAELIYPLRPYGSVGKIVRKTPKYKFIAPVIKAALLWHVGKLVHTPDLYGQLLEDVISFYFYRINQLKKIFGVYYDVEKEGADFILTLNDGSRIVVEVGYGQKGIKQIRKSGKKVEPKYSVLVSERELNVNTEENTVFIPKQIFLLI